MVPLILLGLLAALFWNPVRTVARIGSLPEDDIYPMPGDIITVAVQDPSSNHPFQWQKTTQDIIERFASRGYRVSLMPSGSIPVGGVSFRKFYVTGAAANLAMPRKLNETMVVYSVRR